MSVCDYVRFFLLQPLNSQMCPVIKKEELYLIAIYTIKSAKDKKIKKTASPIQNITEKNTLRLKGGRKEDDSS